MWADKSGRAVRKGGRGERWRWTKHVGRREEGRLMSWPHFSAWGVLLPEGDQKLGLWPWEHQKPSQGREAPQSVSREHPDCPMLSWSCFRV